MNERHRAFADAIEPALRGLYAAAVRLTGSSSSANDLVQDTLLLAYQSWERFDAATNIRAWLHRIQYNAFVSQYRRRKRERELLSRDATGPEYEPLISEHDRRCLHDGGIQRQSLTPTINRALDRLPQEFRTVVIMADIGELTYREIADILGCPMGTVMSRLHRARRALAKDLQATLSPAEIQAYAA
ncbi:MAG: sigma-70 family RNA polymerase sigma factor [Deltaproteobacteria bacterium]|nr:sigma-70 family RNA polymerase sigma factor [Deltaproteobacteria bacterium]